MVYYAIIGDIKASKKIEERNDAQIKMKSVLKHVNELYSDDIAGDFLITLGDEFQGLLRKSDHLLQIIKYIQKMMHPVKIRFGVGIGDISTEINREFAIGADGPAFYSARRMIEDVRKKETKLKEQAPDIQFEVFDSVSLEIDEINTMLQLIKTIEDDWDEGKRQAIWSMMDNPESQMQLAERLNTTQSTISRQLSNGKYNIYTDAMATLEKAVSGLEGL